MQAATERASGQQIVACLFDDFFERFVGDPERGSPARFACAACGGGAYARGGGPPRLAADGSLRKAPKGHFVHLQDTGCSYGKARAGESKAHRDMKRFVAKAIAACPGWKVGVEVPGEGWRADVHAEERHDMDMVGGRHPATDREVVFEIQHTPEAPSRTGHRTDLYLAAGCEVVWLFDDPKANQVGWKPAVLVERLGEESYEVARGIWAPKGNAGRVDLGQFVRAVLARDIRFEELPGSVRPGSRTDQAVRSGWVWKADRAELQGRRRRADRNAKLSQARAEATERLRTMLAGHAITAIEEKGDDPRAAYATVVSTRIGMIAVHPRPHQVRREELDRLRTCAAVIVAGDGDRAAFVTAGLDQMALFDLPQLEPVLAGLVHSSLAAVADQAVAPAPIVPAPQPTVPLPAPAVGRADAEPARRWIRRWIRRRDGR